MKGRIKKIIYITAVIWIAMLVRKLVLHSIVLSILNAILGANIFTALIAIVASAAVTGLIISYMMYRLYREDAEERRDFLNFFSTREFNRYVDKEYILHLKSMREGLITFAIALLVYIAIEFGLLLLISWMFIYDVILIFGIVFGIEVAFEIKARQKLHETWEKERLHKKEAFFRQDF